VIAGHEECAVGFLRQFQEVGHPEVHQPPDPGPEVTHPIGPGGLVPRPPGIQVSQELVVDGVGLGEVVHEEPGRPAPPEPLGTPHELARQELRGLQVAGLGGAVAPHEESGAQRTPLVAGEPRVPGPAACRPVVGLHEVRAIPVRHRHVGVEEEEVAPVVGHLEEPEEEVHVGPGPLPALAAVAGDLQPEGAGEVPGQFPPLEGGGLHRGGVGGDPQRCVRLRSHRDRAVTVLPVDHAEEGVAGGGEAEGAGGNARPQAVQVPPLAGIGPLDQLGGQHALVLHHGIVAVQDIHVGKGQDPAGLPAPLLLPRVPTTLDGRISRKEGRLRHVMSRHRDSRPAGGDPEGFGRQGLVRESPGHVQHPVQVPGKTMLEVTRHPVHVAVRPRPEHCVARSGDRREVGSREFGAGPFVEEAMEGGGLRRFQGAPQDPLADGVDAHQDGGPLVGRAPVSGGREAPRQQEDREERRPRGAAGVERRHRSGVGVEEARKFCPRGGGRAMSVTHPTRDLHAPVTGRPPGLPWCAGSGRVRVAPGVPERTSSRAPPPVPEPVHSRMGFAGVPCSRAFPWPQATEIRVR
jgi:hypothetical protein